MYVENNKDFWKRAINTIKLGKNAEDKVISQKSAVFYILATNNHRIKFKMTTYDHIPKHEIHWDKFSKIYMSPVQ